MVRNNYLYTATHGKKRALPSDQTGHGSANFTMHYIDEDVYDNNDEVEPLKQERGK